MDAKGNISEFAANEGFFDIQANLDLASSDVGLGNLFTSLGLDGNNITFQDLDGLDLESIDPKDFRLTKSSDGRVIINIASQPYQQFLDVDGNPQYTQDGKEFWVIKTF